MNIRQRILSGLYPLIMRLQRRSSKNAVVTPPTATVPVVSFYSLQAITSFGKPFSFQTLRGKYVLVVNTASLCGYTAQYNQLKTLQEKYSEGLQVLAFPSNDFGNQEPGTNESIQAFCTTQFQLPFPLFQKDAVTGQLQQPVYQWLSQANQNGWNNQSPHWNFCKYVIDPTGQLLAFTGPGISPLDERLMRLMQL